MASLAFGECGSRFAAYWNCLQLMPIASAYSPSIPFSSLKICSKHCGTPPQRTQGLDAQRQADLIRIVYFQCEDVLVTGP